MVAVGLLHVGCGSQWIAALSSRIVQPIQRRRQFETPAVKRDLRPLRLPCISMEVKTNSARGIALQPGVWPSPTVKKLKTPHFSVCPTLRRFHTLAENGRLIKQHA